MNGQLCANVRYNKSQFACLLHLFVVAVAFVAPKVLTMTTNDPDPTYLALLMLLLHQKNLRARST